VLCCQNVSKV